MRGFYSYAPERLVSQMPPDRAQQRAANHDGLYNGHQFLADLKGKAAVGKQPGLFGPQQQDAGVASKACEVEDVGAVDDQQGIRTGLPEAPPQAFESLGTQAIRHGSTRRHRFPVDFTGPVKPAVSRATRAA